MNIKDNEIITGQPAFDGRIADYNAVNIFKTQGTYSVANMATEMVTRLALIACIPDGEDSAGRQKCRLPTADEAAERACDIAAALWAQFEQREWLFDIPLPKKLVKQDRQP